MKKILLLGVLMISMSGTSSRFKTVFICTAEKDDAYHLTNDCMMLDSCTYQTVAVTLNDAVKLYSRSLCELEE